MEDRRSFKTALIAMTTLFFAWGFVTSLLDPLVAAVKSIFTLSDVEAQLSAFAFFIAYGLASFPAAALIARVRQVPAILIALGMMAAACLVMLAAANLAVYPLVLIGLFILAGGITVLQVAANPLVAALGRPEGSHFRLTLSQTFNSLGTFIGPFIGAVLFLKGLEVDSAVGSSAAARDAALAGIDRAYFWIFGLLVLLFAFFWLNRKTVAAACPPSQPPRRIGTLISEALSSRWALLGGAAIFLYVGAEVAIGTQMALFLSSEPIWGKSDAFLSFPLFGAIIGSDGVAGASLQQAGKAVACYWGGAMVGRAIGTVLLARFSAGKLMAVFAFIAAVLCAFVIVVGGVPAGFAALSIGLFNSIMFPVIFTLTLERSTASEEATSGFLCTAIVGGAFVPLLVGSVSDRFGYSTAFVVPLVCYGLLCLFALGATRIKVRENATAAVTDPG